MSPTRASLPLPAALLAAGLGWLAAPAPVAAQLACGAPVERFEGGIPAGWSVLGDPGTAPVWSGRAGCGEEGNFTAAGGDAACVSSDRFGIAPFASELRSPTFSLAGASSAALRYAANYQNFAGQDELAVEISADGGASWTPLLLWGEDHGAIRAAAGERVELDLSPWAGQSGLILRWRYQDPDAAAFDWYSQVDDVRLVCDAPPICAAPPATGLVADGGFEAGTPSPSWTESSTGFGTPICTSAACGFAGAADGDAWAFFGGADGAAGSDALEQSVTIAPGVATLTFQLWIPEASGNGTDLVRVLLDGQQVFAAGEGSPAYRQRYLPVRVNLSSFADGGVHLLRFEGQVSGVPGNSNFFVDDVALEVCSAVSQPPEAAVADVELLEGDSGIRQARFTIRLSTPASDPVSVDYATADGTATAGADYAAAAGTIQIPVGDLEAEIAVDVFGETDVEDDESFTLTLSGAVNAALEKAQAVGVILDDDSPPGITIADLSVLETDLGSVDALFELVLSRESALPVTVDYATSAGTATAGDDYLEAGGSVTFPSGATVASLAVRIVGDFLGEPPETFFVDLSNPQNALLRDPQAVGTILNNDAPPEAAIGDAAVQEGDAGDSQAVLTVTLSYPSHLDAVFDYATADGTATAGADYQAATGSLTIPAFATTGEFSVTALGDLEGEDNETLSVILSNPVNASLADAEGVVTILDDDNPDGTCAGANLLANPSADELLVGGALPGWTVVAGAAWGQRAIVPPKEGPFHFFPPRDALSEIAQDVDLTLFAADIDAGTQPFQFEGFIRSRIALDKVRFVVEYRDAAATVLDSFDSGEINSQGVWQRVFDERAAPAGTRAARVRLLGIRESTGDIDTFPDDLAFRAVNPPLVAAGDALVREGDAVTAQAQVPVRLSCASPADTSVDYTTADGTALAGADYAAAAGTLTIPAGVLEGLVPVDVLADLDEEADETFFLDLSSPVNGRLDDPRGEVTILDLAAPVVTVADAAQPEGNAGQSDMVFTVELSNPFAHSVSIDWATAGVTATPGVDYVEAAGTATIAAGATSAEVRIEIAGDTLTEGNEVLTLELGGAVNSSLAASSATGRILDDDAVPIVTAPETGFAEGDEGSRVVRFPILLSAPTDRTVVVLFEVLPLGTAYGGVDFEPASGRAVIARGAVEGAAEVTIYGDTLPEGDEPIRILFSDAFNAVLAVAETRLVILEDDADCVGPNLILNGGAEAGGGDIADWVEVSGDWGRRGGNSPSPLEGGVSFEPQDFSTSYSVFELRQDIDLSAYAANIAAGQQQFFFEGYVRTFDDPSKIFVEYRDAGGNILDSYASGPMANPLAWVRLSHLQLAPPGTASVRVRLRNDEPRGFEDGLYDALSLRPLGAPLLSVGDGEALETDGALSLSVSLNCPDAGPVTVDYATADGSAVAGADYVAAAGTLSFAPGETDKTVAVPLLDDGAVEGDEELFLDLSAAAGAAIATPRGSGRILDDETPPALRILDTDAVEGDAAVHNVYFSVELSRAAAGPVTVDFTTNPNSAAAGSDYVPSSGTVTFAPGSTLEHVIVEVVGDDVAENAETFFVDLSNQVGATLADSRGVARILDDDLGNSVAINNVSIEEGDRGTRDLVFTVSLPRTEFYEDIRMSYATADGSAVAGSDYLPVSGELVIPAGEITGRIAVPIVGDQILEPNNNNDSETLLAILSNVSPSWVVLADGTGVGTIVEHDWYINRFEASERGGMTFVGNTLGLSGTATTPTTDDEAGAFITTDTSLQVGTYPPGTTSDWRLNSSAAVLDLPAGAEVLHAELIWGAVSFGVQAFLDDPVTLTTPAGEYEIEPDPFTSRDAGYTTLYSRTADVTEQVATDGAGVYEVGAVPGHLGTNYDNYAGWTLAVFYRDPSQPLRNLTLMVGWQRCNINSNPIQEPLDLLVPERTPLSGRMATTSGESEVQRNFDFRLLPGEMFSRFAQYLVSGPNNPPSNFFASQINDDQGLLETRGTFGDRNHVRGAPIAGGRQGWDITQVDISPQLSPGLEEMWTFIECWDDSVHAFGFQIDAESAVFPAEVKTVDRAFARSGDLLTYTVDLRNAGSVAAESVVFTDQPPPGTSYVAGSLTADGAPVPGADPAAGVPLGTIAAADNLVVSFQVELLALPPEELPSEYRNRASWTYRYREAPDQPHRFGSATSNEVITWNEDAAVFEIDDLTVTEGDGAMEAVFTVGLSSPLGAAVTIDYATVPGSAVAMSDYLSRAGSLTFAAGELSRTITVPVTDDDLAELTESFTVVLSGAAGVPIRKAEGVATILDDDAATVSVGDVSLIEGNSGSSLAVFTVTQTNTTGQVVTVDYFTEDGSATAGSDYLAQAGALVFDPGVGQLTVAVEVLADLLDEPDEGFSVRLTSPANAALGDDLGLATIVDDDGPVNFGISDSTVYEGDQGNSPAPFTVSIPFPVVHDVSVEFATADDTAVAGTDYVATTGSVLIPAGDTSVGLTVEIIGNTDQDPSRDFFVNLSNPQPHNVGLGDPQGRGRILDDEPRPRVSVADAAVVEGDAGTVDAVFEITVDGASFETMSVTFETWNGVAEAGSDFVGRSGTLTFAPGETAKTVVVQVNGDLEDEVDENFYLRLENPSRIFIARSAGEGFIEDDDDDGTCLGTNLLVNSGAEEVLVDDTLIGWTSVSGRWIRDDIRPVFEPKPAEGFYYFVVDAGSSPEAIQDVDVSRLAAAIDGPGLEFLFDSFISRRQGGNTYVQAIVEYRDAANATVLDAYDTGQLFNSGDWVTRTDQRPAPAGTRFIRVRLLCGGTNSTNVCAADGLELRIAGTPSLAVLDGSLPEGDSGLGSLALPVELSCAAPAPASADYATADGGAVAGVDYQAAAGSLTLDPGETDTTVAIDIFGDREAEADEELFVDLSNLGGALPGRPRGRGVILNDDAPAMDLAICLDASNSLTNSDWDLQLEGLALAVENPAVVPHNNTIRLTVLQFSWDAHLEIGPVVIGDNAVDVAAAIRQLDQFGGATDMAACIDLATQILGTTQPVALKRVIDLSTDGEQTEGNAIRAANDAVAAGIEALNAIGIGGNLDVGFLNAMVRPQPEGGSDGFVVLAASFQEYVSAIQEKIRREVSPDLAVQIDDGVTVAAPGEALTYELLITNGGSGAVTEVILSDFVPSGLLSPLYTSSEGSFDPGSGQWTGVLLESGTSLTLTVAGTIAPAARGSLEAEATVSPPAGVADLDPSDNTDSHTTPLVPSVDLTLAKAAVGQLIAGQTASYLLEVASAGPSQTDGPMELTDQLPPELGFVAATGTGWSCAGAGQSVSCTHPGPLLPGGALPPVQIEALIAGTAGGTVTNTATVAAPEDDPLPANNVAVAQTPVEGIPALAVGGASVQEGDAGTTAVAPVAVLSAPSSLEVRVDWATADGSAAAGADYLAAAGTLIFPPGSVEQPIPLEVLGDVVYEAGETFAVELSGPVNVRLFDDRGLVSILDDDPAPELSIDDVTLEEGDSGLAQAIFTVSLTGPTAIDAEVDFFTADGSALAGEDYLATAGTLTVPFGAGSATLVVEVVGDTASEADETFFVRLASPQQATVADGEGLGTILDDDLSLPELAASKVDALAVDNDGDGVPSPGDVLGYTVTVVNSGGAAATGVELNDLIPAHTAIVAGSVTTTQGTVVSEDPVVVELGAVAAGTPATVSFDVTVDDPVPAGVMDVVNQGTLTSVELPAVLTDDPALGGDADPTVTMIQAEPDLVAEKSDELAVDADGDGVPSPGDTLEYTVTLVNNGNTSATAVALSDAIPAHTAIVAGSVTTTQGTVDAEDPVEVTVGEIAGGGAAVTVTFRVTIDNPVPAGVMEVVNQGVATSAELPPVPTDDPEPAGDADPTATMIRAEPELVVEKTDLLFTDADGDSQASPGDELLYRIEITNAGNTSATGVSISDPLPDDTTVVAGSVQTSQGTVLGEDPVEVDLGEIPGGDGEALVTFRVLVDDPFPATATAVANQATVASVELPDVLSDDPDTPVAADATATEVFITPAIAVADVTELEADAAAAGLAFELTLSEPSNREVGVDYATADGTALAGLDYQAAAGTAVFAPGETTTAVVVAGLDDLLDEADEGFVLDLTNPAGATLPDPEAAGTILDDDPAPLAVIDDVIVTEGDSGTVQALFTVTLSAPSSFVIAIDYATADLTATAGADYQAAAGTLEIPAGAVSAAIPIDVLGDLVDEPDETYRVLLSNPVQVVLADPEGVGTIVDDDLSPPELAASKVDALAVDNDGDGVPSPGDVLGYTVTVVNSGGAAATGVELNDLIPAHTAIVAGSVTTTQGTVVSEDPVVVELGAVAAGTPATVSFDVTVDDPVPAGVMDVVNQGTLTSVELPAVLTDDPALGGDADPTVTMIQAEPDLVAEKSDELAVDADGDGVPSPGDTLEYTVTLVNNGNTSATAVALSDAIPAHTAIVAGSVTTTQGTVDAEDPVEVTVGEIAGGGAAVTVTFRVTIDNPVPAGVMEVVNQGVATSAELPPVPTDDPEPAGDADPTATMIRAEPELVVEKTDLLFTDADGDSQASPGDELLYRIEITNAGNTSATGVSISDPLPDDTTVVAGSVQTSQGTVLGEDPVEVDLGEIPGGDGEALVTFRVLVDDPFPATATAVANQATVASVELPDVLSDDPDTPVAADATATEVFITPAIAVADVTELEADAAAAGLAFELTLSEPSNREVGVDYATADGTALAGLDYQAAAGTAVFAPGETTAAVVVAGLDDPLDEPDETFTLVLSNPAGGTLADAEAVATIVDDDAPPQASIGDVTVTEGDAGTVPAVFTVTLSAPSSFLVTVDFATADLTATAGADYQATAGTLEIPAGAVAATIPVEVIGDLADEADEVFRVLLSNPLQAVLADPEGLGTILDDDPPEISIDDVEVAEGDDGDTVAAVFTLTLSSPAESEVSVDYATADGSAAAGADYQAAAGTLTIAAGESAATLAVTVLGDLLLEDDETFTLELSNAVAGRLVDASGEATILDDEDCPGPNLLANPGAEADPRCGELPGWTPALGDGWQARTADPAPFAGQAYFWAGTGDLAELRQDVDLAAYAAVIASGDQGFRFSGRLRTFDEVPGDTARIVVEYRDTGNAVVLDAWDSGEVTSPAAWQEVADERSAPAGTGWIRVRLLASRLGAAPENDGYFDALSLVSLRQPVVTAGDVALPEGDSGTVAAIFPLTLHCAVGGETALAVETADGSALAGEDYAALPLTPLAFAEGETQLGVPVSVFGDLLEEPDETFALLLSSAPRAVLLDAAGEGTLLDDDRSPFCQLSPEDWKTSDPADWPLASLRLGCDTYDRAGMLCLLESGGSDAATNLARELVATRLNLAAGSEPSILPVAEEADVFLTAWPPGSNPNDDFRREAKRLEELLADYNKADCEDDDSDSDTDSDSDSESNSGSDSDSGSDSGSDSDSAFGSGSRGGNADSGDAAAGAAGSRGSRSNCPPLPAAGRPGSRRPHRDITEASATPAGRTATRERRRFAPADPSAARTARAALGASETVAEPLR